ncbi:flavin reductase family protein [Kitasatospora viridis]|uniref:Flavin reductase (DIM6/NTAB) family NADH-FMN oxidoreductase RutF n=1 Tax=Kitasatospora viridis TaxID=281105 RepID=A0A561UCN9_9ACTN|nr:flavin reductase family protein [Kitasatospora viridis]TWF97116.1 flavin reductase (DIM6/NTAB) family NADH-FMN oxidoreductase RutF [Kitasatospora viridis]
MSTWTYPDPDPLTRAVRPAEEPLPPAEFREAMSHLAGALTVVTTRDALGRRWGFTATSALSVSQSPPLVLVGVGNTSSCLEAMLGSESFTVNVLGERQREVAESFARKGVDRFAGHEFVPWSADGPPRLVDAHAAYRCRTAGSIPVGDHHLLIGEVTGFAAQPADGPLLWHRRDFVALSEKEAVHA